MWWVYQYAQLNGRPYRLIAVYDASKSACGLDLPNLPYLYFVFPVNGYTNHTTCVENCPMY